MPNREVVLATAAFLDSPAAAALRVDRGDLKRVAEAFLSVCFEDQYKAPHRFDGQDIRLALDEGLPARFARRDPLAELVPDALDALFDHLEQTEVVTQSFEIRHALADAMPGFLARVRSGANVEQRRGERAAPFEHGASKLGRNDPCSCGSGKKYKKCHGKNA